MKSLRNLYKIGHGPSSSHTMGPAKACKIMLDSFPDALSFKVTLYGSLALTGKGHLTDKVIESTFAPKKVEIVFDYLTYCSYHSNTLDIIAVMPDGSEKMERFYSIGGGSLEVKGGKNYLEEDVYKENNFKQIQEYCNKRKMNLVDYVVENEGSEIYEYIEEIYNQMEKTIEEGLKKDGLLPGKLGVKRKAKKILETPLSDQNMEYIRKVYAYAYATSEENASGGIVVTAPTCGSSGLIPSLIFAAKDQYGFSKERLMDALLVASIFGNVVKQNASISGAEAGCQAEVGVACSMGAAAYAYLLGASTHQIEVAAEIALEHHLGLTCDPVLGYVQIPCIERNAVCALRAINAAELAIFIDSENKVSFDMVVETMLQTGRDLKEGYKETSLGGLAKEFKD